MPAIFIDVEVSDEARGDTELAKKLEEVCPVDIYKAAPEGLQIVEGASSTSACSAGSRRRTRRLCASSSCTTATAGKRKTLTRPCARLRYEAPARAMARSSAIAIGLVLRVCV